ncbi:polyamine-modulated factor 1-binding protein 1 isoform X5 [Hemicordylus capensis]|uniref:polyamine-modulated factor 1-binding protein 1 isoform X5 n=1 Tax=Hemicordylus capensis TaxID=884348 RepID=UPI0023032AB3|nr:polyamine-modulated factor 1-binding protein 1 isoform X5 [Hemicordylus capensis]
MATRSRLPAHPACRRARLPIGRGRRGGAGLRAQPASRRAASRFGRQIAPEKAAVRAALIGRGAGPGAGCGWTRGTPGAGLPLAAPSFELPGGGGGRWRETRRRPPPPPTVKVRLLQACVVDLSEQDAVLVQTVEELESQMPELLKVAAAEAGQQPPSLAPRRPMPAERRSGSTATQAVLEQEGLRSLAALRELRGEAGRRQEELEAEVPHCEEIVQELQEDLAVSPASQGAAEGSSCRQEEEEEEEAAAAPQQQQKERLLHHKRKMLQSEVHRLKELLRAEPLEACTLAEELHGQGRALHTVQKATRQLEAESRRETTEQALRTEEELAALLEELSTCQTQVGVRSQTIAELQGGLKAAEQEQRQVKEQFTREEAELSSLWRRLRHQQEELSSLQASCAEQEARMVEQTRLIRQLQQEKETSLGQERSKGAGLEEELQGEPGGSQEARQQLHLKLQSLQQELDACKGRNQENLSKLQARQCTVEEQSLDLDLLLQRCQLLKEQLFYYEEVIQKQDLELSRQQAQQRCTQEQLAQAESSLGLYRQKFLASLDRAGQLEEQLQHLETEVASQAQRREEALLQLHTEQLALQEALKSQCLQASRAQGALEQLTQELRGAQEELAHSRQLACPCQETSQGLQEQLAASRAKLLGQEEALAVLHEDLASYKATHSCPNSTYESQRADTEALRQKLLQAEGESAEHQQRAKEYQGLAEALKLELWRAAEQKSSTLQDVARLERTVQSLRQEAAAERERQQLAGAEGRRQLQQLEAELRQSRKESAQRQQAIQKRDELLHKSRAEMVHARGALQEKGKEAEQQRAEALRLEAGLQEAQRELERSRAECASLHTEAQGLRQSLHESQQQAARELARQEEQLLLAQSSLHGAQEQLSQRLAELTHHAQAGRRLETELQVLQERLAGAGAELEQKRDQLEQLAEELSQARQQQQVAKEEAQHQRQVAAQLERDLEESRVGLRGLQKQLQSQESTLEVLRADLSQREEALQGELQAAQQQESRLAQERHDLQRQLQRAQQRVLRQEATLAQLHTELHSLQERERQRSRSLAAAQGLAQELQLQAAACQASQRQAAEQLEERAQEASCLQAELQQGQHKAAHLQEELAASHAQAAQLKSQLSALQRAQEQQACASEERLDGLSGQVRHWQGEQRAAKLALAAKDEELVVVKVELASLEEKYHRAREENEELQSEVNLLRQKFVVSSREVESLQTSLEAARSDSHRLNHESELVVANVSQWVKEQKLVNEKLGHKIRSQVKQLAQLTGERDHLQGLVEKLQREKRCLQSEVGERRLECERLKARHSSEWDPRAVRQQPWPLLQGEDPPCATERRGKALAAKWNLS